MIRDRIARHLLIATLASTAYASAQSHPGGVLVGECTDANSVAYLTGIQRVDRNSGAWTTVLGALAPRPSNVVDMKMATDNRRLVLAVDRKNSASSLQSGVFVFDPATSGYSTLVSSTSAFYRPEGLVPNQDGDWWVPVVDFGLTALVYRVGASGGYSTALTTLALGGRFFFTELALRDVDTGALLLPATGTLGTIRNPIFAMADDGSVSTWHASQQGSSPIMGYAQRLSDGDLYYVFNGIIYRTRPGTAPRTFKTITGIGGEYAAGAIFENQSLASPQLITYSARAQNAGTTAHLRYVDPDTGVVTRSVQFINDPGFARTPYPANRLLHERARYLSTTMTGSRKWRIDVNMPAFALKNYTMAITAAGVRPGIRLSDGRRIWLNVDTLLILSVTNQLFPFFNAGSLTLDASGHAQGTLDFSLLPASVRARFHIGAIVLDPASPLGIGFVAEPIPFNL